VLLCSGTSSIFRTNSEDLFAITNLPHWVNIIMTATLNIFISKRIWSRKVYSNTGKQPYAILVRFVVSVVFTCCSGQVKPKVPYDSYVIDFTVMPYEGQPELLPIAVVELNPFDAYTDGALFNWTLHKKCVIDASDAKLLVLSDSCRTLYEGPFTFKLQDECKKEKDKTWWKRIIDRHLSITK